MGFLTPSEPKPMSESPNSNSEVSSPVVASPERRPGYVQGSILRSILERQKKTTTEPPTESLNGLAQPVVVSPNTVAPVTKDAVAPQVSPSTSSASTSDATVPVAWRPGEVSTSAKDLLTVPVTLAPDLSAPTSAQSNSKPQSGSLKTTFSSEATFLTRSLSNGTSLQRAVLTEKMIIPLSATDTLTLSIGTRVNLTKDAKGREFLAIQPQAGATLKIKTPAGEMISAGGLVRVDLTTGVVILDGDASIKLPNGVALTGGFQYDATKNILSELRAGVTIPITRLTTLDLASFTGTNRTSSATLVGAGITQKIDDFSVSVGLVNDFRGSIQPYVKGTGKLGDVNISAVLGSEPSSFRDGTIVELKATIPFRF